MKQKQILNKPVGVCSECPNVYIPTHPKRLTCSDECQRQRQLRLNREYSRARYSPIKAKGKREAKRKLLEAEADAEVIKQPTYLETILRRGIF